MVKIIAKTLSKHKITNTILYTSETDFVVGQFFDHVKEICEKLDTPTPIVLTKHFRDYILFNTTSFSTQDFVEKVYFDKLILQAFTE